MTATSKSNSKLLLVIATLVLWMGTANAERRRIAVLEFEGPKAEKFHEDVVKLLKKSHTVISVEKWNGMAEELDAAKVTAKNVKKVAKKLKVDGIVTGIIDKRRDEYIIRLKLRAGTSGETTGTSVQTKADGPRLDAQAQRDIKDELVGAIDELDSNRGGDDEEEEEDTPKKKKKGDEEEEEEEGTKKGFGGKKMKGGDEEEEEVKETKAQKKAREEEEKAAAKKAKEEEEKAKKKKKLDEEKAALTTKKDSEDEEEEEEEGDTKKKRKKNSDDEEDEEGGKKTASSEEDEEGGSVEEESEEASTDHALNVSPSRRAVDAVVGLSFTARKLNFTYASDLGKAPPGYKQTIPVAGALVDLTVYPLSIGHKNTSITSGIGATVLYDQVIKINSQKKFTDAMNNQQVADLKTAESRWSIGGVLRYPLGTEAKSIVVGGTLEYGKQKFSVEQAIPNSGNPLQKTDIPNVSYSIISPGAFIQAPVIPKVVLNASAKFLLVTDTGDIQTQAQYGAATVTGFEFTVGADYMLMKNVFVRAAFRYQTFGFTFKGDPMSMANTRDSDPEQDVQGARDSYMGGVATVGYAY